MNIGLIDVDGNSRIKKWGAKPFPNLALAKLSRYHKQIGDSVEWYTPFEHYQLVYKSKVFTDSEDFNEYINADKVVQGGTGYAINGAGGETYCKDQDPPLPDYVEHIYPDYSIYGITNTAYGFLTRGCPNKCFWCVVPKKEGGVKPYMDVDEIAIEGRKNLVLMDNNILAAGDYALEQFAKIIDRGYKVDFNQALDARLVNETNAELLAKVKWIDRVRFGCDTHKQIEDCEKAIALLERFGYRGEIFLYTMIGGKSDFAECFERINYWRNRLLEARRTHKRCQVFAYAQPYRDPTKRHQTIPMWQKDLTNWTNKRMIFTMTEFKDFEPRKNFKCKEYFK